MTFEAAWHYLVSIAPDGVLSSRDRPILEIAAWLFPDFRCDPDRFDVRKLAKLEQILGKLGLNPADASRVSAGQPRKPLSDFD